MNGIRNNSVPIRTGLVRELAARVSGGLDTWRYGWMEINTEGMNTELSCMKQIYTNVMLDGWSEDCAGCQRKPPDDARVWEKYRCESGII